MGSFKGFRYLLPLKQSKAAVLQVNTPQAVNLTVLLVLVQRFSLG